MQQVFLKFVEGLNLNEYMYKFIILLNLNTFKNLFTEYVTDFFSLAETVALYQNH